MGQTEVGSFSQGDEALRKTFVLMDEEHTVLRRRKMLCCKIGSSCELQFSVLKV